MVKLLAKVWLRVCPVRPIYIKCCRSCGWIPAWAFFGVVYYSHWWSGPFPLRLTIDGSGIILRGDLIGRGRPLPYFQWYPRKWRAAF